MAEEAFQAQRSRRWFKGDRVLWVIVAVLAVISVLVVYSSTAKMAYDPRTLRSTTHFLNQQVIILLLSLGTMLLVQRLNSRFYNRLSGLVYLLSLLLTLSVYFLGFSTNEGRYGDVSGPSIGRSAIEDR